MSYFTGSFRIQGNTAKNLTIETSAIQNCTIDMGNRTINNVALPIVPPDAANKEYVDMLFSQVRLNVSVTLSGKEKVFVVNPTVPGSYTIHVASTQTDGPVAQFAVAKNNPEKHAMINTVVQVPSSSGERLELEWAPNLSIVLFKTGNNFDGVYNVRII